MPVEKRKTLANCKLSEFTAQANKTRKQMYEFYHLINVRSIVDKYAKEVNNGADRDEMSRMLISDVIDAIMTDHPHESVAIIASCAFMSVDEAEQLDPSEALEIVIECISSQRVMDFFIRLERLAGSDTDSILPALLLIRGAISEMNSSGSESQRSTTSSAVSDTVGATSESAQGF